MTINYSSSDYAMMRLRVHIAPSTVAVDVLEKRLSHTVQSGTLEEIKIVDSRQSFDGRGWLCKLDTFDRPLIALLILFSTDNVPPIIIDVLTENEADKKFVAGDWKRS